MSSPTTSPASVKVVVTGPYGSGKTTLVRTLSEVTVLTTERRGRSEAEGEAAGVAMDFGRLSVPPDMTLYLFGAPGHGGAEGLWDILSPGLLGFVVLVDHERPDAAEEASSILEDFSARMHAPFVVVVNRVPGGGEDRAIRRARHQLRLDDDVRVLAADVRDEVQARTVLVELLTAVREHVLTAETATV